MEISESYNAKRVKLNLAALAELKKQNPDLSVLEQYSGWGGLRDAVYDKSVYRQLKSLLNDEDISKLKSTFRSAYYTPENLVRFIYRKLEDMQFRPERILEPSAGNGVFVRNMPAQWRKKSSLVLVEMDNISCQLLKSLCPLAHVAHIPFEQYQADQHFDLIIGNPPYGQTKVVDSLYPDLSRYSIHHYFVAKSMRLLRPGGILAMVVPRYFMDAPEKHVRRIIANEGGSLLEAYRMPDDLFQDAKVTVDIIFLKKESSDRRWINSSPYIQDGKRAWMNEYFFQNVNKVLGNIEFIEVYGRNELTCKRTMELDGLLEANQEVEAMHASSLLAFNPSGYQPFLDNLISKLMTKKEEISKEIQFISALKDEISVYESQCVGLCRKLGMLESKYN